MIHKKNVVAADPVGSNAVADVWPLNAGQRGRGMSLGHGHGCGGAKKDNKRGGYRRNRMIA